jgi:hypothetical protein
LLVLLTVERVKLYELPFHAIRRQTLHGPMREAARRGSVLDRDVILATIPPPNRFAVLRAFAQQHPENVSFGFFSLRQYKIANCRDGHCSGQFSLGFRGFYRRDANLRDSTNRQFASPKPFRLFPTEPARFGFAWKSSSLFKDLKIWSTEPSTPNLSATKTN